MNITISNFGWFVTLPDGSVRECATDDEARELREAEEDKDE